MNPAAVLALIGELYAQVSTLQQENEALKSRLAAEQPSAPGPSS
ncbi:hypothetical protein QFZ23_003797 [Arthrobacter globiformis]|nr:hypothetical protein [Arthrobacter globiformis]